VAVVLALEALLHSALSFVSFALEDFTLPDQALVDDFISIFWPAELYDDARCSLCARVSGQPSYVFDIRLRDERPVIL
jgi:hypothetical protein